MLNHCDRISMHSFHFHTGKISHPPFLPIPGDASNIEDFAEAASKPLPTYMGGTFTKFCEFWKIVHEVIWSHYDGDDITIPYDIATLGFAETTYRRLLEWADTLPLMLARGDQNSHHVVTMQYVFSVTQPVMLIAKWDAVRSFPLFVY
jgi:hypothetical protein